MGYEAGNRRPLIGSAGKNLDSITIEERHRPRSGVRRQPRASSGERVGGLPGHPGGSPPMCRVSGVRPLMTAPLELPTDAAPEAVLEGVGGEAIQGRSLGQIAWMRLRRDKVAMAGGAVIIFLILVAIIGPFLVQSPTLYHHDLINPTFSRPNGPFGGISLSHPFGVEPVTGRDMLSRVVYGARVSLLIAFLATALAVSIGVVMGVLSGYAGGWLDAVIARTMDVFLAFPLLVFAIALVGVIPSSAFGLSGNSLRIGLLIFVIGFFAWPYMGRIIRGQTLSLREREFVDAARSLGARGPYVLFRELLPNLV